MQPFPSPGNKLQQTSLAPGRRPLSLETQTVLYVLLIYAPEIRNSGQGCTEQGRTHWAYVRRLFFWMVKIVGGEFGCFCSVWISTLAVCLSSGSQPQRLFICTYQLAFSNLTPWQFSQKWLWTSLSKRANSFFFLCSLIGGFLLAFHCQAFKDIKESFFFPFLKKCTDESVLMAFS